MGCLLLPFPVVSVSIPNCCFLPCSNSSSALNSSVSFRRVFCPPKQSSLNFSSMLRPFSLSNPLDLDSDNDNEDGDNEDQETLVQDLRVPDDWLIPSKALQESEWLRVTLHKWLDEEYCPEATNVEISKVASRSYYESLIEKNADLGEILLKIARDLESISYQESFHGAFSSANAAVNLIALRIEQE